MHQLFLDITLLLLTLASLIHPTTRSLWSIKAIKIFEGKPPECVHVGVEEHLGEGDEQVEDQPDLNHLHIGGGRQGARD